MNTEQARLFFLLQKIGGADVGSEHAFFNKAMGVVTDDGYDGFDFAFVVKTHLGFNRIEVDGASLEAGSVQRLEQCVERMQLRLKGLMHGRCRLQLT